MSLGDNDRLFLFKGDRKMKWLILFLSIISAANIEAQKFDEKSVVYPNDRHREKYFAYQIEALPKFSKFLVGAPKDNQGGVRSGAVYVFNRLDLQQIQKIKSPTLRINQGFGHSLSVDSKGMIIGAPGIPYYTKAHGKAFIYESTNEQAMNWNLIKELRGTEGHSKDFFGEAVQILEDLVFVGAPGWQKKGVVFVFQRNEGGQNNWGQIMKVEAPGYTQDFGKALAFDGEYLVIGAPGEKENSGAIYIYKKQDNEALFNLHQKIEGIDKNDYWGYRINLHEGILVFSAREDVSGTVYVYELETSSQQWKRVQQIKADYNRNIYGFGESIELKGNCLFVGTPDYNDYRGGFYVYRRDSLSKENPWKKVYRPEYSYRANYDDMMGTSICVYDSNTLLVGGPSKTENGKLSILSMDVGLKSLKTKMPASIHKPVKKQELPIVKEDIAAEKTVIEKEKPSRIMQLGQHLNLGELTFGQNINKNLHIKNDGNEVLKIHNVVASSNIMLPYKSFAVSPGDSFSYSFNYTADGTSTGFIEFVSNKTRGNNRIEIIADVQEESRYQLELPNSLQLEKQMLGETICSKINISNKGNRTITIDKIEASAGIKIKQSVVKLKPEQTYSLPFQMLLTSTGEQEGKILLHAKEPGITKKVIVRCDSYLGGNELMLKNCLLNVPSMMDGRLLVNMEKVDASNIEVIIGKMGQQPLKVVNIKNDQKGFVLVPLNGLDKNETYQVKVIGDDKGFPLAQSIFSL